VREQEQEQEEEEREVEEFRGYKVVGSGEENSELWHVKWKGFPDTDNSWEPLENLLNGQDAIADFHARQATQTGTEECGGGFDRLKNVCSNTSDYRVYDNPKPLSSSPKRDR
jgi:hypothetical protein